MKRAFILVLLAASGLLMSCGGRGSTSTNQVRTSGIKKRAFVTNQYAGQIAIINAANDTVNTGISLDALGNPVATLANTINVASGASIMAESADKKTTLVFGQTFFSVAVVDNTTETVIGNITLPSFTESLLMGTDGKTAYAAVRNAPVTGQPSGAVDVLDLTNYVISAIIPVPAVRRIVLSHNGAKMLAFSDNSNQVTVIDTSAKTTKAVGGFDRPVWGVFAVDDSKAYIMSCGPECGGSAAQVSVLDLSSNTVTASTPVSAATTGLLDGNNLYVAGTAAGVGRLDVVDVTSMKPTKSGVAISDGYHQPIALANGQLFVGSRTCANLTQGCLSIYNVSSGAVANSKPGGDVTGMEPIDGRNVVYVIEGGELVIYDTTTAAPPKTQLDIVGKAYDVKLVD